MQSVTRGHYRILVAVLLQVAICSFLTGTALAQNTGYPVVESSTMMTASQSYLDATQFTTTTGRGTACLANSINNDTDAAAMIQQAICALPATGGTVDARGFANQTAFLPPITFQSNPFADPHTSSNGGNVIVTSTGNTTNTTNAISEGEAIIYAEAGVAITYAIGYASMGTIQMEYEVHIQVEAL